MRDTLAEILISEGVMEASSLRRALYAMIRFPLPRPKIDDSIREFLADYFARYYKAGGRFTLDEWQGLGRAGRAAASLAGEDVEVSNSLRSGLASQDRHAAAVVAEPYDDGELRTAVSLDILAARMLAR